MSDVAAISARIAEIQSTIAALRPPAPATARIAGANAGATSGGAAGASAEGTSFAARLAAANATQAGAALGGTLDGTAGVGDLGALLRQGAAATSTAAAPTDGDAVVQDARRYLGVPYRWGGTDPSTGLDCSGLVQRVFADLGVQVPRTVTGQRAVGTAVPSMADARPGDLLVFGNHHIGIYVGDGKMLHAPKSGDVVKVARVYETPNRIRRVLPAGDGVSTVAATANTAATARPSALRQSAGASSTYDSLFTSATARYGLPPGLLRAVAKAESGFDAGARSPAGAIGLMQLMPGTARELGVDPRNPTQAVDGAARLLRDHLKTFGSVPLALAAYNAGPGAVRQYHGIPPFGETQAYVRRILATMKGSS